MKLNVDLINNQFIINNKPGLDFNKSLYEIQASFKAREWKSENKYWVAPICGRNLYLYCYHNDLFDFHDAMVEPDFDNDYLNESWLELKENLFNYQTEIYNEILSRLIFYCGADPRMGKTLPTLLAVVNILRQGYIHCLFVTTKSAQRGIYKEIEKWKIDRFLDNNLSIITYDNLHKYNQVISNKTILVLDELHEVKDNTTQRFKVVQELVERQDLDYYKKFLELGNITLPLCRIGLSGTPAPENIFNWWSPLEILRAGYILEKSINDFKKRYAEIEENTSESGAYWLKVLSYKKDQVDLLPKRLEKIVRCFHRKDYNIEPKIIWDIIDIPVPEEEIEALKVIKEYYTGSTLGNILRQASDGIIYETSIDQEGSKTKEGSSFVTAKDNAFVDTLNIYTEEKRSVCFCFFIEAIEKLTRLARQSGWSVLKICGGKETVISENSELTSDLFLDAFDASNPKREQLLKELPPLLIISQSDAGTTGKEYSMSSNIIVYSATWKAANFIQGLDRITSQNSIYPVKTYHFLHYHAVDKYVYNKVQAKVDAQLDITEELTNLKENNMLPLHVN